MAQVFGTYTVRATGNASDPRISHRKLSVLPEKLPPVTPTAPARGVADLRYQVETGSAAWLSADLTRH
ncbi:MAG: hypothetical protein ACRDPD_12585 [Streptosporangiaceae bacterium]